MGACLAVQLNRVSVVLFFLSVQLWCLSCCILKQGFRWSTLSSFVSFGACLSVHCTAQQSLRCIILSLCSISKTGSQMYHSFFFCTEWVSFFLYSKAGSQMYHSFFFCTAWVPVLLSIARSQMFYSFFVSV
jgi:hypothetical protein